MSEKMKIAKYIAPSPDGRALAGKRALITGANSGIGFEAALLFAEQGAAVILACRNPARADAAAERIRAAVPQVDVATVTVDLASDASISRFGEEVRKRYEKLDILLHCAGVYYPRGNATADGLPLTVGINYVGTRRVTEELLPLLSEESRVIFTTSLVDRFGHAEGETSVNEPVGEGYRAYARSKLLLSAYALCRARDRADGEPAFLAVHPGITATSLLAPEKTTHKPLFSRLGHAFLYLFTHSPRKAALTALYAAAGDTRNGDCIGPRGLFGISGYPHKTKYCKNVRKLARKYG